MIIYSYRIIILFFYVSRVMPREVRAYQVGTLEGS